MLLISVGCASAETTQGKNAEILTDRAGAGPISRAQLQDALLRYQASMNEALREGFKKLEKSPSASIRAQVARNRLNYATSAMAIAIGAVPEANLLDMVAFVELSSDVFRTYWAPKVFGPDAAGVLTAWERCRNGIWELAEKVLTPEQIPKLRKVIHLWQEAHPGQTAVEGVRLTVFSAETGAKAREIQEEVGGLLAGVKKAMTAADQGILLGERSLYYFQYLPYLLRMQARVGVEDMGMAFNDVLQEIVGGAGLSGDSRNQAGQAPDAEGTIAELQKLASSGLKDGAVLTQEIRDLMELVYRNRNLEASKMRNEMIRSIVDILREYNQALGSPVHAKTIDQLNGSVSQFESATHRIILHVGVMLAAVILLTGATVLGSRMAYTRWKTRQR